MAVNPSVTITEKFPSRVTGVGQDVRTEMYFIVSGTTSEIDARDSLWASPSCPNTYNPQLTNVNTGSASLSP